MHNSRFTAVAAGALCMALLQTKSWAAVVPSPVDGFSKVWFDELTLEDMSCGWEKPRKNKSVEGNPLQIGSKTFETARMDKHRKGNQK